MKIKMSFLWSIAGGVSAIGLIITGKPHLGIMALLCLILAELEEIKEKMEAERG